MDMLIAIKAVILGIVEGLTEFLPISSTGHLILAGGMLRFTGEKAKIFEVFIQLGAILAVVWVYRAKILSVLSMLPSDREARRLSIGVIIAFFPAAVAGLAAHHFIKEYLFNPITVSAALVGGGIVILLIERARHKNEIDDIDNITPYAALGVGVAQIAALFPGVSRSGATIMGGLMFGMTRKAATEFSFFLAIPTMFAATIYDLSKGISNLDAADMQVFAVGFAAAFFSALWVVRWLLKFIAHHDFKAFAYYRIVFGLILLVFYYFR